MNNHIPAEEFAAYVDGLLPGAKKDELEKHFSQCPACLDDLADIMAVRHGCRRKIPHEFLVKSLGEKKGASRPVLHLRLVFEIAAALVVVVFIGYLFLGNNRFWQTPEQPKPTLILEKDLRPADSSTALRKDEITSLPAKQRERAATQKANNEQIKIDADQRLADSHALKKWTSNDTGADLPAAKTGAVQAHAPENKLNENTEGKFQAVTEKESSEKKKLPRTTAVTETVDQEQLNFSAEDKQTHLPVRIEGEAARSDLRNPELLITWTWFRKGLILELQIDGAGTVVDVVPLGKFDKSLARQAENEAKKLIFSVSEKKLRQARLIANEKPPI